MTELATVLPPPRALPPFTSCDHDGQPLGPRDFFQRHWTLVFFGFTHCPDVCPTTLATARADDTKQLADLPAAAAAAVLFVSVDPERDDADAALGRT